MRDIHIIRVKNQFLEIDLQTRPHNFLESNFYKSLLETIFYKKKLNRSKQSLSNYSVTPRGDAFSDELSNP
jgi:hypothetical protein